MFLYLQKDFQQEVGHSSNLGQKQSGLLLTTKDHKEDGTKSLNWWWSNSEKADTQFSEPRVHCLEERSKAEEVGNYQYTSALMGERLKLFFAKWFLLISSVSTEQSQILWIIQSLPSLFVPTSSLMKTPAPSTDDPAQGDLLHKYQERVERLSQQNRVSKFCTDAGFLTTVEVGQYFMTKDTEDFSQFSESVACREYTLPRDAKSSDPEDWIRGNTKIGPVLEVTTSYFQGKCGVEVRIESGNKDNSHSWVRNSHGLNELVTDLSNNKEDNNNEQETSEMQFEDFALKTNVLAFASRSKAKAKPRRRTLACSSARTIPIGERTWTDIEPEDYSPVACPVSNWPGSTASCMVQAENVEETSNHGVLGRHQTCSKERI